MNYEEILTHFEVSSRRGNKAQCHCPVHDDKQASLSISLDNGKILFHCFAGCEYKDIIAAAGLTNTDVNGERPEDGVIEKLSWFIANKMNWTDENGKTHKGYGEEAKVTDV